MLCKYSALSNLQNNTSFFFFSPDEHHFHSSATTWSLPSSSLLCVFWGLWRILSARLGGLRSDAAPRSAASHVGSLISASSSLLTELSSWAERDKTGTFQTDIWTHFLFFIPISVLLTQLCISVVLDKQNFHRLTRRIIQSNKTNSFFIPGI